MKAIATASMTTVTRAVNELFSRPLAPEAFHRTQTKAQNEAGFPSRRACAHDGPAIRGWAGTLDDVTR